MSDELNHGWRPGDRPPSVDNEGESDFVMVLAKGLTAPAVGYYLDTAHGAAPGWRLYPTAMQYEVRWWKPLEKIPASLFPLSSHRWVIETGIAFDDTKGDQDATAH